MFLKYIAGHCWTKPFFFRFHIYPRRLDVLDCRTLHIPTHSYTLLSRFPLHVVGPREPDTIRPADHTPNMRPTTSTKQFYLLGENVAQAQDVDIPSSIDEDGLRHLIASNFAIVDAKGESLWTHIPVTESQLTLARHWFSKRE